MINETVRVAAVQMNATEDKAANVATATRLVQQAAAQGAQLVALPELFNCLGRLERVVGLAEAIPGPTSDAMSELAARLGITLCAGSICESAEISGKGYNTSLTFGPDGRLLARYRKMHLFDVDLEPGVCIRESGYMIPGGETVVVDTPLGHLGFATCYDLRFPELFRKLADAQVDIVMLPSAFVQTTGRDHWQVLLRARAIENQVFVVAPNQCGPQVKDVVSYGHSQIIDPWGTVLTEAGGDGEGILVADLTAQRLRDVRRRLPSLAHRRDALRESTTGV